MAREQYVSQVQLLVRSLPYIGEEKAFALKGGTAINLFYRDLPRLSVDIDLTYLPVKPREESLWDIDETLDRIGSNISQHLRGAKIRRIAGGGGNETRLEVSQGATVIKVETSPVARGSVHPVDVRTVSEKVEDEFGFAEMQVLSFEDLFGGKLHAAVDRQHPRDLFDVKLLYANEGFTDALFRTFLIYVASSGRPPHELLAPSITDIEATFRQEFEGITVEPVKLEDLLEVRRRLLADIRDKLDVHARTFLLSLHDCEPDFDVVGLPQAASLPAVKWKLLNLQKLKAQNPRKHEQQRAEIESLFE
ncbi:nucleotidyl transferase AbiEii/AbiGii toxin family protein [Bradyrhizobium sp. BRP14]|nr:nucleotidyl transferase AbiEii/AbiGii toxin family protein [Bradyrhizobium sp. BRP14]